MTRSAPNRRTSSSLRGLQVVATLAPAARAAIIDHLSGNHRATSENNSGFRTTTNFAVFDLTGGQSGDTFGTGYDGFDTNFLSGNASPGLDTSAKYLYLYEVVNDSISSLSVEGFHLEFAENSVTSWGQWDFVFNDEDGVVQPGNPFGQNGASHMTVAPANVGVMDPSFSPSQLGLDASQVNWQDSFFTAIHSLASGEQSRIFGFTSNHAPTLWQPTLEECPNHFACGAVPIPAPEPSTYLLGLAAMASLISLLSGGRRRLVRYTAVND